MYKNVSTCVPCRCRLARPQRPPQGPLPTLRVPDAAGPVAFHSAAFDCAGPYRVKRGRTYETYYMLLATCCHTRAVRLEVLSDLSLDAFMMAFSRLQYRGVQPKMILTDNGTNFDGASRIFAHLLGKLKEDQVEKKTPKIRWQFNPPYASHFGGVFERLIGAAKSALYHALPSHFSLSLEQLYTAFAEVEGLLNARPLAYVSGEMGEITPLTPNHFLAGSASVPLLEGPWDGERSLPKRWAAVQEALSSFRRRFAEEILPHLQQATKTRGCTRDLKEGDVVTFLLPSASNKWPLAIVHKVFPGTDGRVRVIELWKPNLCAPLRPSLRPRKEKRSQPIRSGSDSGRKEEPITSGSVTKAGRTPPGEEKKEEGEWSAGSFFRRDVGAVALLLPVEATEQHHF